MTCSWKKLARRVATLIKFRRSSSDPPANKTSLPAPTASLNSTLQDAKAAAADDTKLALDATVEKAPGPHFSLHDLENFAKQELEDIAQVVDELKNAKNHTVREMTKYAEHVVNGVGHVIQYVEVFAGLHPAAEAVVGAVKKVVGLEKQRHENDAHIAVIHTYMINTVFHLNVLGSISHDQLSHVESHMQSVCHNFKTTINEFGMFVDVYHNQWQKIYKFLFAEHHREKLEHFRVTFSNYRGDLDRLSVMVNGKQLSTVSSNVTRTLSHLDEVLNKSGDIFKLVDKFDSRLEGIEEWIMAHGGASGVIQSDQYLEELGIKLNERITDNMKVVLRTEFDQILQGHEQVSHVI
ncbi:uncharacterized protein BXZ73DRAFT_104431 [Epithele typhae]|uniref:uncharacterized protein n=1 Tax=Epithele typhae TaxID=378194 RepID=UPI0020073566|nr:uncharacterized protein BXZ73DRAFT_104431 [Epithele typhae]KAH9921549.1 hypothetical protein BXZ73DRAFT_104431 [Epithele typhae]